MSTEQRLVPTRSDVALMEGYHSPQSDVAVRLNTNEAPEPPPPAFVAELMKEVAGVAFNRYPSREAWALREAIGTLHGVGPEQVYAANGSNEVIQAILLAYGGAARAAIVFEPTYALHSHIARVTATPVIEGERDDAFLLEPSELDRTLKEAADRPGADGPPVVFLCSPNNPTGRLEPFEHLELALERAPGLVVVDEAYGQFAPRSAIELASTKPRLVVLRTFSKTWSLAALRLGYAIAAAPVVAALEQVTLPYHLDAVKQAAGRLALSYRSEMDARVARLVAERERVAHALEAMPLEVVPSDANFILFRVLEHDARAVWQELVAASVLVRDVSGWPRLAGHLRVTIGTPLENDRFLEALTRSLS